MNTLAYQQQIFQIATLSSEPYVARKQCDWWRERLQTLEQPQQHPILRQLQADVEQYRLNTASLLSIIDAAEMDIDISSYPTWRELRLFFQRKYNGFYDVLYKIFERNDLDEHHTNLLSEIAQYTGTIFMLRDIGFDARRHHMYIPQVDLERFGLDASRLLLEESNESFASMVLYQLEQLAPPTFKIEALKNHRSLRIMRKICLVCNEVSQLIQEDILTIKTSYIQLSSWRTVYQMLCRA